MTAPYTPADEHRCTAATVRGTRCRHAVDSWPEGAGENPRKCATHLAPEQRAARDHAIDRALAEAFAPQTPEQRAAVERRTRIFTAATPGCWDWPATAPSFEELLTALPDSLRRDFGADEELRADMVLDAWHQGRCAICEARGSLVTDHNHATGLVRGLLCRSCNTREGLDHRPGTVFAAYRQRHPAAILGLTVRYVDPYTHQYATPLPPPGPLTTNHQE